MLLKKGEGDETVLKASGACWTSMHCRVLSAESPALRTGPSMGTGDKPNNSSLIEIKSFLRSCHLSGEYKS